MSNLTHLITSLRMKNFRALATKLWILLVIFSLVTPVRNAQATPLDTPTLLTPANAAKITAAAEFDSIAMPPVAVPEFTWSQVVGATSYRIQLSQDVAFNTRIEFTTPSTRFTPISASSLSDGPWFWRVRVDGPSAGQYSETWSFTRQWASDNNFPVLVSPADFATLEFLDSPVFSWQHAIGAAHYRFQVSAAPEFTTLLVNILTVATTHQPLVKLPNGTYYWRVIPLDPANRTGTVSEMRSFTLGYNRIPTQIAPANSSLPTFTPTFRWTAVRGASLYRLQYSTDPSFNSGINQIDTRNTTYTPSNLLPNDVNYYWRVRAHSGNSITDWSPVWSFKKQWYIQPQLLTPVNLYQHQRFPFFSWTPVPGTSYYKVEVDYNIDFSPPVEITGNTSNPYFMPHPRYSGDRNIRYWRVTPYDKSGNKGVTSNVFSYISSQDEVAPQQVYPLYYYPPSTYPSPDQAVFLNPHEDRTVPLPIFMWQRVTVPYPVGGAYAAAYRLEVDDDPLFGSVNWNVDTENVSATPTQADPFIPTSGVNYFWRVCPLNALAGSCLMTSDPIPVPLWSQIWRARIDTSQVLTPTLGTAPVLLRPVRESEQVEFTPVFEWWPMNGADAYNIQISDDPTFTTTDLSETVKYPAYSPTTMLAQRDLLNRFNYGTYYWRVRGMFGGSPIGVFSDVWRFQVASQSHWQFGRSLGSSSNKLQIASDPDEPAITDYDLTKLYAAQDKDNWYIGFDATAPTVNVTYTLYLDVDHIEGSGATFDARGLNLNAIPAHYPEFAIYIFGQAGVFAADKVAVYGWNGAGWNTPQLLSSIGGSIYNSLGYVELKVPNTAIGMNVTTGSYALSITSFPALGGNPQDSVPSDPGIPGGQTLSRFASVSERMMTIMPPNNVENDPRTFASFPAFFWEYPTGSNGTAPWAGARIEVNLDPQFTGTAAGTYLLESNGVHYAWTTTHWSSDLLGDNTYYWRIQTRYLTGDILTPILFSVWSQPTRFERKGFRPLNLQQSVTFATPTFSWDLVEGADSYDIQLDTDPNFGTPDVNVNTTQNSYTPVNTLANGLTYWRVRARRYSNVVNEWSDVVTFTLALPIPQGLSPNDPGELNVIGTSPTLCWTPLIVSDGTYPVLAAAKYKVQVSRGDPTFSLPYDSADTEQACWTPTKGYRDGKYYWRVAMYDGQSRMGDYSPAAEFTKQYPRAVPKSPISGSSTAETPTFTWTAADTVTPYVLGAAAYKLEISKSATYSPIYESITTNNTRYTPTRVYDTNTTYYWRVAIVDGDNELGPFSDATIILDPNAGSTRLFLPMVTNP